MQSRAVAVCVAALLACGGEGLWAGDGVVALQTADPSCPDDSGNIYVDCGNGTVTDNRTGLVWLAQANCLKGTTGGGGSVDWFTAMEFVSGLSDKPPTSVAAAHDCGLSDGSSPGEWRLPSVEEWEAMIADAVVLGCTFFQFGDPSITNDSGTQCWQGGPGSAFSDIRSERYWSASTVVDDPSLAWHGFLTIGSVTDFPKRLEGFVWPVRGGQ